MMKVAIVEPVGGHGGMNYYDFSLARGLSDAGADVTVYTCDRTNVPSAIPFKVKITFNKIWGEKHKIVRAFRFLFCLLKTLFDIKRKHFHIVHYHFFHYTLMEELCVLFARFFTLTTVVTAHDVKSFAGDTSEHAAGRILSKVHKIIAHNKVSKKALMKNAQVSAEKISIIPHGNYLSSTLDIPSRFEARQRLLLPPDSPILLFFGQIKKVKGLDLLLKAMPSIRYRFPDLKLVIAGKVWKDDFSKYDNLIQENNLQNNVVLHIRYIPDEEVAFFYRAADLLILPYRRIYQSGVLLLAMSYKVPVIVSDLEGMLEIVKNNHNGFIFQSGNVNSLSQQIIAALSSFQQMRQVAEDGYKTVVQNHNWNTIGQQTLRLYQTITLE